jgi:hypothetical protein
MGIKCFEYGSRFRPVLDLVDAVDFAQLVSLGDFMVLAVTCLNRRYMPGASVGRLIRSVPWYLNRKEFHLFIAISIC